MGSPQIYYFDEISSTNDEAKKMAVNGVPEFTTVTAEVQTNGQGRFGRQWRSDAGGLYMSTVLRPKIPPEKCAALTLAAGIAVAETIRLVYGLDAMIKWPNDVIINMRKTAGILLSVECCGLTGVREVDFLILGIGVNVNNSDFSKELYGKATSVFLESGVKADKDLLLKHIIGGIKDVYRQFINNGFGCLTMQYKKLCVNIGQNVTAVKNNGQIKGIAIDITETGEILILQENGQTVAVAGGEVSLRGENGNSYL